MIKTLLFSILLIIILSYIVLLLSPAAAKGEAVDSLRAAAPIIIEKPKAPTLDLDKLAQAVAIAENSCNKSALARQRHNCYGIMEWDSAGNPRMRTFKTKEEGTQAFKELWQRKYQKYPDREMAVKYTGNDSPDDWLMAINSSYNP